VRYSHRPISPERSGELSPHTISGYVRTLKVFSKWLYDEGFTKEDLFLRLKRPRLPEPVIEVLSNREIAKVMDCINPNTFDFGRVFRAKQLPTLSCKCQSSLNYGIICD
jgi:site-specific recombinase XerD